MEHYINGRTSHVEEVENEIVKNGGDLTNLTKEQEDDLAFADILDMLDLEILSESIYQSK